jgi:hypothetical protein
MTKLVIIGTPATIAALCAVGMGRLRLVDLVARLVRGGGKRRLVEAVSQ